MREFFDIRNGNDDIVKVIGEFLSLDILDLGQDALADGWLKS